MSDAANWARNRPPRLSPELAEIVSKIVGERSLEQAAISAGHRPSREAIRALRQGKVGREETVREFAEGFFDDLVRLYGQEIRDEFGDCEPERVSDWLAEKAGFHTVGGPLLARAAYLRERLSMARAQGAYHVQVDMRALMLPCSVSEARERARQSMPINPDLRVADLSSRSILIPCGFLERSLAKGMADALFEVAGWDRPQGGRAVSAIGTHEDQLVERVTRLTAKAVKEVLETLFEPEILTDGRRELWVRRPDGATGSGEVAPDTSNGRQEAPI